LTFPAGIKNNIRTAFEKQMYYGRAISNDPYIHLCRFSISGGTGDSALGTEGTQVDESQYFVEADIDMPKITETALKFETSVGGAAQTIFYIPSTPVYYTDYIEYGSEMRTNAHLYNDVLKCETARFQSNGVKVGDTIKIFYKPITGGVYSLEYTDLVKTIDTETQITLSAGIGITGVTRAYSLRTYKYDITAILPDDEYGYVVINTERQI
jgi:hypothetical protein